MKALPESIELTVTSNKKPRAGVLVLLRLGVTRKNSYSYILGPTNKNGKASISKCELIREANKAASLALMDYVSLEEGYSGKIDAVIMTETHIRRAIDACETYGSAMYPSEYLDTLQTALRNSNGIDGCEIQIIQK